MIWSRTSKSTSEVGISEIRKGTSVSETGSKWYLREGAKKALHRPKPSTEEPKKRAQRRLSHKRGILQRSPNSKPRGSKYRAGQKQR